MTCLPEIQFQLGKTVLNDTYQAKRIKTVIR